VTSEGRGRGRGPAFRLALPFTNNDPDWDNSEDPSWDDYTGSDKVASKIALYDGNTLVWGEEPTPPCGPGTGVNCVPTADNKSVSTAFGTAVGVTLSGSDSDGTIASFSVTSGPANGAVSGSGANRTYTPDSGFSGSDSFLYTVTDNDGAESAPATVSISVAPPIAPSVSITSPGQSTSFGFQGTHDGSFQVPTCSGN
jgi:hypothetical protein